MLQNQKAEPESEPKCSKKSFEIWRILSFKDRNDLFSTLLLCENLHPNKDCAGPTDRLKYYAFFHDARLL